MFDSSLNKTCFDLRWKFLYYSPERAILGLSWSNLGKTMSLGPPRASMASCSAGNTQTSTKCHDCKENHML